MSGTDMRYKWFCVLFSLTAILLMAGCNANTQTESSNEDTTKIASSQKTVINLSITLDGTVKFTDFNGKTIVPKDKKEFFPLDISKFPKQSSFSSINFEIFEGNPAYKVFVTTEAGAICQLVHYEVEMVDNRAVVHYNDPVPCP